jgi:calcineurin-like phosphoesterase family protein
MNYFTSDWHIGHTNVLSFCNRPFPNTSMMLKHFVERTNRRVKPTDTLWLLGDIFFYATTREMKEIIRSIKCKVVLVKGNHDHNTSSLRSVCQVVDYAVISLGKTQVSLSHYPLRPSWWQRIKRRLQRRPSTRFFERCPEQFNDCWHLHGHVHSKERYSGKFGRQIHVGVDAWNYNIVSQDEILDLIRKETTN